MVVTKLFIQNCFERIDVFISNLPYYWIFQLKVFAKFLKNILRSVLFITICYYFKSCEFLFICLDIETNPGYTDGLFRFCCWNTNSLILHQFQRVASLQAYITLNDLHLICVTESALKFFFSNDQIEISGYIPIRNDLTDNDSHGGVLIYRKADLAVKHRLDIQNYKNTLVLELSISRKKVC